MEVLQYYFEKEGVRGVCRISSLPRLLSFLFQRWYFLACLLVNWCGMGQEYNRAEFVGVLTASIKHSKEAATTLLSYLCISLEFLNAALLMPFLPNSRDLLSDNTRHDN